MNDELSFQIGNLDDKFVSKVTCTVDEYGNKFYRNEKGEYHREDGPALEYDDGYKEWRINGKKHREDGPAVERASGNKYWYKNGLRHREDGPAIEFINGDKKWYINGKLHREDGPATEYVSGHKEYWIEGVIVLNFIENYEIQFVKN